MKEARRYRPSFSKTRHMSTSNLVCPVPGCLWVRAVALPDGEPGKTSCGIGAVVAYGGGWLAYGTKVDGTKRIPGTGLFRTRRDAGEALMVNLPKWMR